MSRKRNKFLIALIILLVAAIIGTLAYIVVKNLNENNERKSLDNIAGSYASGIENGTTSATEVTSPSINVKKIENPIDFKSLQQQNSDIYSWIYIPNTNVNYPVLQSHLDVTYILTTIFIRITAFRAVSIRRCATSVIIPTELLCFTVIIWQTAQCLQRSIAFMMPISLTRTGTSMFTLPTESLHTKLCQLLNMITDTL